MRKQSWFVAAYRREALVALCLLVIVGALAYFDVSADAQRMRPRPQVQPDAATRLEKAIANEKANPSKAAALEVDAALLENNPNGFASTGPASPDATGAEGEPNDTAATATPLTFTPTAIATAAINPGGDIDFYTFTAPAGSRVWLETDTGGTQNAGATSRDTVVDLLAADGTTVIENDDDDGTGNGGDGTIETGLASIIAGRTLTTGGTYFIRVQAFSAAAIINPYRLFVSLTNVAATPEVEGNDTAATANVANSPALRSGSIGVAGDVDYYSVSANAGDTIFFPVDADPARTGVGTDLVVEFRDPADALLLSVDSSINGSLANPAAEGANYTVPAAGTYFVKVRHFDATLTGTYDIHIIKTPAVTSPLSISSFRVRGPSGANDEYVEIYNNGATSTTVASQVGTGYGIVASDGVVRCTIPNGTVIPSGGHFLCANSVAYSLSGYAAGNGTTATADATYTTDIPDNAGIALFNNNVAANFTLANRLDAVGSDSEANTLYKEGTGYPALTPFSIDYSFVRDACGKGGSITVFGPCSISKPKDTDNNAVDFYFVDTNGTSAGAGQRLGAPGPQNLSAPIATNQILVQIIDPGCTATAGPPTSACTIARDNTSVPAQNSTFGTVDWRMKLTNNSGANVTRLRLRVVDQSTFPAPSGVADLRTRTSSSFVGNLSGGGTTTIQGTTLEQPPSQPNGSAFNCSMSVDTVTLGTPLAAGASVNVHVLMGTQQTGHYKIGILTEALGTNITGATSVVTGIQGFTESPTAAKVTISGRVLNAAGNGLRSARVTISDSRGNSFTAVTNAFGYYSFGEVPSGDTYVANASVRGAVFAPRVVTVNDAIEGLDFSPQ